MVVILHVAHLYSNLSCACNFVKKNCHVHVIKQIMFDPGNKT